MPYKDKEKQRTAQREWARKNRVATNAHRTVARRKAQERVRVIKEASPCSDCGEFYPYYVMQFDHINDDKLGNVGEMVSKNVAWSRVKKEMKKCELVCANCHAIRTFNRN